MQLDFDLTGKPAPKPDKPAKTDRAEPVVFSVGSLTRRIRDMLEDGLGDVWVEGEISNLRRQSSGHVYFTLKDATAQLACLMFARTASGLREVGFADGLQLEVLGGISVYEPRGQYQLIVKNARARGAGALHAKFEALKRKLEAEGLFDPARKKPLPRFPARLGLVTSPTGAAIRDFLNVLHRRHPGIQVIINPVRVQGRGAASEIARAVKEFGEPGKWNLPVVDVVVVTRGGGSLEDLWEFNEEEVARAVAASPVPVVSAVGHEIDFTICDFASDFRAPTPSAAAEILSADAAELVARLRRDAGRMATTCRQMMESTRLRLQNVRSSTLFREPRRRLDEASQRLDRAGMDITRLAGEALTRRKVDLLRFVSAFDPTLLLSRVANLRLQAAGALLRLQEPPRRKISEVSNRLGILAAKLSSLDPRVTLERGFTMTCGPDGIPLRSARDAIAAGHLQTRFADGKVSSVVSKEE
jgi:exodeoxyribonuclease VII large subunit